MAKKLKKREILDSKYVGSVSREEIERAVKKVKAMKIEVPADTEALYATAPHLKRKH